MTKFVSVLHDFFTSLQLLYTSPANFPALLDATMLVVGVAVGIGACAITFRIPTKELPFATAAGFLGWEVMYCLQSYDVPTLTATTLGALSISLCSEILARDRKVPAPIYVVPGILPLVPGRAIYFAMFSSLEGDYGAYHSGATQALLGAGGISIGMLIGTAIARGLVHPHHRQRVALERKQQRVLHSQQSMVAQKVREEQAQKRAELAKEQIADELSNPETERTGLSLKPEDWPLIRPDALDEIAGFTTREQRLEQANKQRQHTQRQLYEDFLAKHRPHKKRPLRHGHKRHR